MLGLGLSLSSTPVIGGAINAPSFALDFRNGDNPVTKYGFVFTRATTATYVNSAGLLATAASGELRYDYDPVTLAPRGILVEEASTNLATLSGIAHVAGSATTSVTQSQTDPAGGTTATLFSGTGVGQAYVYNDTAPSVAYTSGTTYTLSKYVKPGTATRLQLSASFSPFGNIYANFSLTGSGSVLASSGCTATIIQSGLWYRIAITAAATSTAGGTYGVAGFINSDTATRLPSFDSTGLSAYVGLSQIEAKAFATSYIPTTGAAATRNADALTLTGAAGRTNLIVGSAAPATQNVTTTATAYTLSHTGTGTITLSGTSTDGPLVGAGSLTFTPSAGTLTLTMSGTVTNAQLETGSSATTYIPTTNGPRTVENVASWFNGDAGTVVAAAAVNTSSTGFQCAFSVTATSSSISRVYNGRYLLKSNFANSVEAVNQFDLSSSASFDSGAPFLQACAYSVNDFELYTSGTRAGTGDQTGKLCYALKDVAIGNRNSGSYFNGTIAYLAYYPRRLSNASLQALTA